MSLPAADLPSTSYITPTKRAAFAQSAEAGPSRIRPSGASPAYSSRRHSLYGIEDRIIIDPGSRIWKVGFSGETRPRAVFWAQDKSDEDGEEMWDLNLDSLQGCHGDRREAGRLVGVRIVKKMRETFYKHLSADPKSRKVIILESTYLPSFVKEHIAQALFDNLKVPSISFTSSALLSLLACGRVTGLVVDCGWLETTVTPVAYSRPLFHLSRSTPLAGRSLHRRLRALLHHHATYYAPPASVDDITRIPQNPVPLNILTDRFIERVLTEGCFVGGVMIDEAMENEDDPMEGDVPALTEEIDDVRLMNRLKRRYQRESIAKDQKYSIAPADTSSGGLGPGTLLVPGWIRERVAEILFEEDKSWESSGIPDTILQTLLKLPIDLRPILISQILVTGGTASLPGFIPRLRISLLRNLLPPPSSSQTEPTPPLHTPAHRKVEIREWRQKKGEPYSALYGLAGKVAILNDPSAVEGDGRAGEGGKAPRWVPSLMAWVGGSLAGAMKTSSPEIQREEYDTLCAEHIARGENWRTMLEEAEVEMAALVGVDMESLRPGMALEGSEGRKRGWRDEGVLGDWVGFGGVRVGG